MIPEKGHQALRKGRVSEAGRIYFITKNARIRVKEEWSTSQKLRIGTLLQPGVPELILETLEWLQEHQLLNLLAWCIMPDHLHLLFQLEQNASLDKVLKQFGSFTGLKAYRQTGHGKLWVEGYYDHALRDEEVLEAIAAYIEQNPVNAGLVNHPEEWQWSSATGANLKSLDRE